MQLVQLYFNHMASSVKDIDSYTMDSQGQSSYNVIETPLIQSFFLATIMNDQEDDCIICKKFKQKMLMINCGHDLCVDCAAETYVDQTQIKGQSKEVYICQICGDKNSLDNSSIAQLIRINSAFMKLHTLKPPPPVRKVSSIPQKELNRKPPPPPPVRKVSSISQKESNRKPPPPPVRPKKQVNQSQITLKGEDFFAYMKNNGIQDETINILSTQGINQMIWLRECSQEMLVISGIKLIEVIKLKKL